MSSRGERLSRFRAALSSRATTEMISPLVQRFLDDAKLLGSEPTTASAAVRDDLNVRNKHVLWARLKPHLSFLCVRSKREPVYYSAEDRKRNNFESTKLTAKEIRQATKRTGSVPFVLSDANPSRPQITISRSPRTRPTAPT